MKSKWANKKEEAVRLRRDGQSIRYIEDVTGVPRSTLSGWLREIKLSIRHTRNLERKQREALQRARMKAAVWHRKQKVLRHAEAQRAAGDVFSRVDLHDINTLKIVLAGLYMGEGAKRDGNLVLASSNPVILSFYVNALRRAYNVPRERLSIELHIRTDQDGALLMRYWLKTLRLPKTSAGSIHIDRRTKKSPTRPGYKGVCLVNGGGSAIQRELVYLGNALFEHFGNDTNMRV